MSRWLSNTRYYSATIEQDLLGDWVVRTVHGGLHNRLGGGRTHVVENQAAGEALIAAIHKIRIRHGYHRVSEGDSL